MSDGKLPDLGSLMSMAQKLQGDMQRVQEDLSRKTVGASAGGGMVSCVVNGKNEIVSLSIDKEVVNADDVEMLQDLIIAAVNQAHEKMQREHAEAMAQVTGGLPIPGLTL